MKKLKIVCFIFIGILLFSCKTQTATVKKVEEKPTNNLTTLSSGKWLLQDENGPMKGVDGQNVFIELKDNSISGFGGCNGFQGKAEYLESGSIKFSEMIATQRYCEGYNSENKIMSLFNATNRFEIKSNELKLFDGNLELLRFKKSG